MAYALVPGAGIEPARPYRREILSLQCLPVSPSGQRGEILAQVMLVTPSCACLLDRWSAFFIVFDRPGLCVGYDGPAIRSVETDVCCKMKYPLQHGK